ncbi:MAG: glycosyltransferase family 4 protein [Akkermansia sp.]
MARILSIFNRYRQYGGEETVSGHITQLLSTAHEVTSLTPSTNEIQGNTLLSKLSFPLRGLYNRDIKHQLEKLQATHHFDYWLVHNVFPAMSPSVYETAFRLNVPLIHMVHNYRMGCINGLMLRDNSHCELCIDHHFKYGIQNKCYRNSFIMSLFGSAFQWRSQKIGLFEKTAAFIALSNAQVPFLKRMGIPENKIQIIPHFLSSTTDEIRPIPDKGYVLFMGRLSKEKGTMGFLQAWNEINPKDRKLLIAGTGPEEETMKDFVKNNNLHSVEFLGFVSTEHHQELWKNCSFYAMPSICEETAALSMLEGWKYGRPALAFNKGAANDYLSQCPAGWLAKLEKKGSLTETLRQALDTPHEQLTKMGNAGREYVNKYHTETTWLNSFNALLQSINER